MAANDSKKHGSAHSRRNVIAGIANTLEWLVTAFILAFTFRAFVMEAFRIPTGSMADTLKGAHFRLCCTQCGYRFDYNFGGERIPNYDVYIPEAPRCSSCGYFLPDTLKMPVANGDRILVLKCIYQLLEPKRWDVVVFKNPGEPRINYIKRLVGRPEETVEIIDGDIYIDGQIARKPSRVQQQLWMPVYDNDYQPAQPDERRFNGHRWRQPFQNKFASKWRLNPAPTYENQVSTSWSRADPTVFMLDRPPDEISFMFYDTTIGNDFRATYAYDPASTYRDLPYCSDLMVRFYVDSSLMQGSIGIGLSKYESHYKAVVDLSGRMFIAKTENGSAPVKLTDKKIDPPPLNKPVLIRFTNVDHQLIFQFGDEELSYDLGLGPNDAGPLMQGIAPEVTIFGSGKLAVSHLAIFRDIHYTNRMSNGKAGYAAQGKPFTLRRDEFFVLGDNSPASHDCRFWFNDGIGNNQNSYRPGIVPRDYLVGKAVFVYWPSGFKPFTDCPLAFIPNVGQIRFIYGGSPR